MGEGTGTVKYRAGQIGRNRTWNKGRERLSRAGRALGGGDKK